MTTGTVFVTGSSSGIGLVTAVELALRGHRVLAPIRDPGRAAPLRAAAEAAGVGDRVHVLSLDLAAGSDGLEATVREAMAAQARSTTS